MQVKLAINKYWPEGVTVKAASEELGLSTKAVGRIKAGTDRGFWNTLFDIQSWLESHGIEKSIEELFTIEED